MILIKKICSDFQKLEFLKQNSLSPLSSMQQNRSSFTSITKSCHIYRKTKII
ncbi:unnamed protein product [Paramecium sonneborni]|uniref:Uncharacterized protein n=1 Tax=Paramecium sonneborni TaxID=65129 RepID=A0A8S1RP61_9CILI|nr:unnamed protein product [Paramecium sonneborni]